jgi:hypothetical protein
MRAGVIAATVVVVLMILAAAASTLYTEVLWFDEVGYSEVFWTGVWTRLGLGAVFGVIFAVLLLVNLWIVRKITNPARLFTVSDQILERYRATLQPYTKWIVIGGAILFGFFAGSGASVQWRNWLLFSNAQDFGATDPVFSRDIGFYVFRLPFHRFLFTWGFSTLAVITIVVGVAHYLMGGIRPQARTDRVAPEVRAHLSVLLGLIVLLKAWGYRLDQYDLLYSARGTVTGASYTDVNAQLPALKLLVVIAIVVSVFFLINARFKNWILPIAGIAILALTSILAGGVYPAIVQRVRVTPNERQLEADFIKRNIDSTRRAYAIDAVAATPFPAEPGVEEAEVENSRATVQNIRLWEPSVLVDQYVTLQRIKPYYEFLDVDIDRYDFNGQRRQVMLAAREVDTAGLSPDAQTWLNQHLVYTHGYGVVANRVDRVTVEGQPDFIFRDIPPRPAPEGGPVLEQNQIYFGESSRPAFVVGNTTQDELDYPSGEGEEEGSEEVTKYDGDGGIAMGSIFRRAAFAWRFRDVNLMISSAIHAESRIMFRRQILERARHVAPFLQFDTDPYIAIVDGRLVWILDGYTSTEMYPYSERIDFGGVSDGSVNGVGNYIRNAAKFMIDAKEGTVTGYAWDEEDPILRAWMQVFPDLFQPRSAMSDDLLDHVRYPEGQFMIQSNRLATYHITDPIDFYGKGDAWSVARDPDPRIASLQRPPVPPYYVLQTLPGEEGLDFVLVRPFTPANRQNLSAYLVAHGDPEKYGKLVLYRFPNSDAIFGPEQVQGRINQDGAVAQQISLWDQQQSEVIYGNLLIVPLGDSLLYVQPLYLLGEGSRLPELRRVVAVTGNTVRMADTLPAALTAIFEGLPSDIEGEEPPPGQTPEEILVEIREHLEAAQAALERGDLAGYAREVDAARRAAERAAEEQESAPQQ